MELATIATKQHDKGDIYFFVLGFIIYFFLYDKRTLANLPSLFFVPGGILVFLWLNWDFKKGGGKKYEPFF